MNKASPDRYPFKKPVSSPDAVKKPAVPATENKEKVKPKAVMPPGL
jgi:hypothetical protein